MRASCIFPVVHVNEVDAIEGSERGEPHSRPSEQVSRTGQGNARPERREGGIGHDVALEWLHERDARILATAAIGPSLVVHLGLQRDAESLHSRGLAGFVETDSGDADPRVVPLRDDSWEQIESTIWASRRRRIQHAKSLLSVAWLRFHQHLETP
jgi:hypothetical protein